MEKVVFSDKFISASKYYTSFDKHINAPMFRRVFEIAEETVPVTLTVCGLGLYRVFLNGEDITASYLAPYISNLDDYVYYNHYDLTGKLQKGKNVLGFILGNGMLNNIGGFVWGFDKAKFRSAPKLAFALNINGEIIEADERVKTHNSAITFDDIRAGERYDARLEQDGWALVDFDDSKWKSSIPAVSPQGEKRIGMADPIVVTEEIKPCKFYRGDGGYIYDFGVNTSGIVRLKINAKKGQQIQILHSEIVNDGKADMRNISFEGFTKPNYNQCIQYICKDGENIYMPSFCYMGFRYAYITGITDEQATEDLLTMLKMNSDIGRKSSFECSDKTINQLYKNAINSTESNFWFFPTDCPQREKNGWTGDIMLSADQMLLNFFAENSLREWMYNVRKAQVESGQIPGVVPTTGFGYKWGNGPGWDGVLVELPYRLYQYTGDDIYIRENADAIFHYLHYMEGKKRADGLVAYGLGDWCQVNVNGVENYSTPLYVTDTLICIDTCRKAKFLYEVIGQAERAAYCETLHNDFVSAFRANCINAKKEVSGDTQSGQAMALYYGVFKEDERQEAFERLVALIAEKDNHFDVGVLGGRVLFRVLADFGRIDLAHRLITVPTFPSFAYQLQFGATSLWESFYEINDRFELLSGKYFDILSQNHHFWGDISAFFIEYFLGIKVNPKMRAEMAVEISPSIFDGISTAKGHYDTANGRVSVEWKVENSVFTIQVDVPDGLPVFLKMPNGDTSTLKAGKTIQICEL